MACIGTGIFDRSCGVMCDTEKDNDDERTSTDRSKAPLTQVVVVGALFMFFGLAFLNASATHPATPPPSTTNPHPALDRASLDLLASLSSRRMPLSETWIIEPSLFSRVRAQSRLLIPIKTTSPRSRAQVLYDRSCATFSGPWCIKKGDEPWALHALLLDAIGLVGVVVGLRSYGHARHHRLGRRSSK
jgi:hypothetical protein